MHPLFDKAESAFIWNKNENRFLLKLFNI